MRVTIKQRSRSTIRLKAISYSAATKATEEQAEAGTDNQHYMTSLGTKQQIDARLVDQATAEAGTDNSKLMTALRTKQQADARLSTQAEAEAGTNNTKTMTPLRAANATQSNVFPTRAALLGRDVPAVQTVVRTSGYATAGDGGGAEYVFAASEPSHPGKFQMPDGRWWELAERSVNELMFGADPTGTADSYQAIQNCMDFVAMTGATYRGAPGQFLVSAMVTCLPGPVDGGGANHYYRGPTWEFDNAATYVCTAPSLVDALFKFGDDDSNYEKLTSNGLVKGGVFDCNAKANRGLWVAALNRFVVRDTEVRNMGGTAPRGIQFGSAGGLIGYEGFAQNNRIIGKLPLAAVISGARGIHFENCTDNQSDSNVISGVDIAIGADSTSGWDGKHTNNHAWNWSDNGTMSYGFYLYGDNYLSGNQVDGPFSYYAAFEGPRNDVIGAKVNYGSNAADVDNTAALFRLEASGEVTVTNSGFKATASKRIAAECSFGSGVATSAYRKDGSNRYLYVLSAQPVTIGVGANVHVTISGGTPTVQSKSANISSVTKNGTGDYFVNFSEAINEHAAVVVTPSISGGLETIAAMESKANRTSTAIRLLFVNEADTAIDPGAFSMVVVN